MTLKYIMPAAHPLLLLIALISLAVVSALQQAPAPSIVRSSPHLQLQFHHHRREHNTCSYSSALHQSLYDDANDDDYYYDEFDDWNNSDGWYNDNDDGMQQQQYNNNNMNTQFPPPPYDRPPYSSNLRNNIASVSSPSPYDNPSWTKSSRYGNRNVNFNSRSNRVNTFDYLPRGTATTTNDRYTPRYYDNSNFMPNDEYYNNNNNESPSRPFSLNQLSRKLYRDYDYDDDPNSSSTRGGGSSSRFQGRNGSNNNSNNSPYQRSSESSRYRDYDDGNYAYSRSYRNDNDEQDGARSGSNNFPPRPESQYRDYDDINYAPSRSYRREEGPMKNGNSRTVDDDNNNRSKYTKFPPPPPPPPRRRRSQSIPNNFAPPQSNRSDSPRINFPPGVGSMGYTPPSEYIPQNNNNNNNGRVVGGGRSSRNPPPPPRPPPQRPPPRPPQSRYNNNINNNNNKQKYQYDINRQEKYIDDEELRRSQTQYNFPNGETIRNERINTLRPIGFNSIFSDMFTPFTQMFRSASQSLQSSDMLKEARLRIVEDDVIRTKLGEPLEVSPPFSQSSSMSSVATINNNGEQNNSKASSTKVRARFQVGGPYGTGVATMDSVDGMIRSLVVDVNGVTVRIGPRQRKNGGGSSRNGNRRKNVVEAEILDD